MTQSTTQQNTLTLTATQVTQLRDHLLQEDNLERVAYVYCSPGGDGRLLVEELVLISDEDTIGQSQTACRPSRDVELGLVQDCLRRGMHPLIIHSHPFDHSTAPRFSPRDNALMDDLYTYITGHEPDATPMFGVLGAKSITAAVYTDDKKREPLPITVIGNHRLDPDLHGAADTLATADTDIDTARFDRTIRALGEPGQQRLAATHIAIVGCGGLGSVMAEEFARYGIGELTLIDPDVVEETNLPRLFGAGDDDIGRPKVKVVRDHLYHIDDRVWVTPLKKRVEEAETALQRADLIVAGVDRVSTRQWLNAFAVQYLLPYVDAGVVISTDDTADGGDPRVETMDGYIQTILPGATGCFTCHNRGDPEQARIERLSEDELQEELEQGYIEETQLSPAPAVVPLNGIVASKTVQLVAKLVTGYAQPADYLHFEGVHNELTTVNMTPRESCPTCGRTGVLGRGTRDPSDADVAAADYDLDLDSGFALAPVDTSVNADPATVTAAIHTATTTASGLLARLQDRLFH